MKEIIYIQAGTLSNYTGTHFWNTQENYLLDSENEDSLVDSEISFREGLSPTGQSTFCPRLLVFDRKVNFGTLAETNALLGTNEEDLLDEDIAVTWNGDVTEYRQEPIEKSTYHSSLDETIDTDKANTSDGPTVGDVRYWSDFNRVYYVPRTIQKIPDPPEWENPDGDWNSGRELFSRYNEVCDIIAPWLWSIEGTTKDADLMDESLRLFLEECDSVQGLQVVNDTASFGAFTHSFLTSFRDEFVKLPCLVFPLLSDAVSRHIDIDDYQGFRELVNDALYLRGVKELASMSVPIQSPAVWPAESLSWSQSTGTNVTYRNSALLSAHIESSTLPLRLLGTHENIASWAAQLDWRGVTPFAELSGVFPVRSSFRDLDTRMVNFSAASWRTDVAGHTQFSRRDVTRGFSTADITGYDEWLTRSSIQGTLASRTHAPAYVIPSSFPSIKVCDPDRSRHETLAAPRATAMFSSISTGSSTARLFEKYAKGVERVTKRRVGLEKLGVDVDDLGDLVNDLWTLHADFGDGGSGTGQEEEMGSVGEDEN